MTDSMIPEVWQHPEGGVVWVRVDPYDSLFTSLPYRVVRPDGTVAWAGGVPVDAAVRMVPETIADAMRGLHDSAAPPRPLDPTNPDDLRAVEVFLGWYVTNYDTVLLLPLRQREVAYEAIQETRRHLDMTADWVAREALRARKIDAIAESTADWLPGDACDYRNEANAALAALEAMEAEQ